MAKGEDEDTEKILTLAGPFLETTAAIASSSSSSPLRAQMAADSTPGKRAKELDGDSCGCRVAMRLYHAPWEPPTRTPRAVADRQSR